VIRYKSSEGLERVKIDMFQLHEDTYRSGAC
jgi:hypothetical protein